MEYPILTLIFFFLVAGQEWFRNRCFCTQIVAFRAFNEQNRAFKKRENKNKQIHLSKAWEPEQVGTGCFWLLGARAA